MMNSNFSVGVRTITFTHSCPQCLSVGHMKKHGSDGQLEPERVNNGVYQRVMSPKTHEMEDVF